MYKLPVFETIKERILEPRKFIQVVMGPRQVGKSTVVRQVLHEIEIPYKSFSADYVPATNTQWILECWETARVLYSQGNSPFLLIIDEIQKIENWSEIVKKLWDEDSFHNRAIKVLLLGSSRVLLEKGLSDSLAGRFEVIKMSQWSFTEMRDCFGFDVNQFIYYGGYPGAAQLIGDQLRFDDYIQSSIIESTINRDILMGSAINKPALLRRTFEVAAAYSGNILSYTKLIGQLQDAGNTTTVAHYLDLLNEACLVDGLMKYSNDFARTRNSIPKFQVYANSLKNVFYPLSYEEAMQSPSKWGNIFESGIGAYILSQAFRYRIEVFYWREKNWEVDFILRKKGVLVALEVKSNFESVTTGLEEFNKRFKPHRSLIIGSNGMAPEEFLTIPILSLFK